MFWREWRGGFSNIALFAGFLSILELKFGFGVWLFVSVCFVSCVGLDTYMWSMVVVEKDGVAAQPSSVR